MANQIASEYIEKKRPFDNSDLKELAQKIWKEKILNEKNESQLKGRVEDEETTKENSKKSDQDSEFKASNAWCSEYKKKWGFSSVKPRKSRIATSYTDEDITKFLNECYEGLKMVKLSNFFNMDETFFHYINFPISTFGFTGSESTQISYKGNEKQGFTTILCVSASVCLLKPIIIKKRKTQRTLKKVVLPPNIEACFSNSGWVNCGILKLLLKNIHEHTKGENAILILDQYPTHADDCIVNEATSLNIKLIFVPAGLTSKLQPLDVGINGPIKSSSKKFYKSDRANNDNFQPTFNIAVQHLYDSITKVVDKKLVIEAFNKALNIELESEHLTDNETQALLNNTGALLKSIPLCIPDKK